MIGLGVGIDYALFIVTRYREDLHARPRRRASRSRIAIDTAGRAVLFAGTTVVISLLGMLLMGVGFVSGLGDRRRRRRRSSRCSRRSRCCRRCSASPATRIERHPLAGPHRRRPRRRRASSASGSGSRRSSSALPLAVVVLRRRLLRARRCKREVPQRGARSRCARPLAYRWSRVDPAPPVAGGASARPSCCSCSPSRCSACASASPTRATSPRTRTTRQAYDLLVEGFGPGFNGPLLPRRRAARRAPTPAALARGHRRRRAPTRASRSSSARSPTTRPARPPCCWRVVPTTGPQDEATTELVDRLRDDVLPAGRASGTGARRRRHRLRRRQRRLLRLPRRRACRASSAPCWRCRSCC